MRRLSPELRERLVRLQRKHLRRERKLAKRKRRVVRKGLEREESRSLPFCRLIRAVPALNVHRGRATVLVPARFSFYEDPESALGVLSALATLMDRRDFTEVHLDHSKCEYLDLGASVAMDVVALELRNFFVRRGRHIDFSGTYPKDPSVREILRTTGIIKHLGVHHEIRQDFERYRLFELFAGTKRPVKPRESSDHERAAQRLVEYLAACLGGQGCQLTREGYRDITKMVTEVLNNAEEHSGSHRWWVIGYLRQETRDLGQCNVAMLNLGRTIYQSLTDRASDPRMRRRMKALSRLHRMRSLFRGGWSEEALWTLYSLQEGVTRFRPEEGGDTRGLGTVRLIETFQDLGRRADEAASPRMCLVSGSSHIRFDGRYRMKSRGPEERRIIAFNEANSLGAKPDPEAVMALGGFLPGTLISMQFFVDGRYLRKRVGGLA